MKKFNIDNYILQNYKEKTNTQMALECGCNVSTISNHRKKLGISATELNKQLRDKIPYICSQKGKKTKSQLAKELNCSKEFIKKIWGENDLKSKLVYSYDENYFENIDTPEKAYWLGFISADGCLYRREGHQGLVSIQINEKDIEILNNFKEELKTEKPINISQDKRRPDTIMTNLQITGDNFFNSILDKGIGIRKTYDLDMKLVLNNIPKRFFSAYMLGYFDGDGSIDIPNSGISKSHIRISGPERILKVFREYLINFSIDSNILLDKRKYSEPFGSLEFINTTQKYIFLKFIYSNNVKCLNRKKERAEELFYRIENNITNRSENIKAVNNLKSVVVKWGELLER